MLGACGQAKTSLSAQWEIVRLGFNNSLFGLSKLQVLIGTSV